ncbi:MAG: TonB-dependent siderophore receptor [Acidobacteriaceae bacterium]
MQQKHGGRLWRSASARWMAMGTLMAYTAAGGRTSAIAYAQQADGAGKGNSSAAANLPVRRFNIAAGPLDVALRSFHDETGLQVQLQIPQETVAGFRTQGVTGLYTVEQAMKLLLVGTGLSYAYADANTLAIGLWHHDSVEVTANANSNLSLSRYTEPVLDTPQSISVVPQWVMQQQNATTLRDTLRNVPGISLAAGEGGSQGDNLTIRGFSARNDIFLDGMRDFGSYYRDSFDYEEVDVLQGPSGVTFGRGSTGGIINQETKHPEPQPFIHVGTEFGTDLTRRMTADINEPLPELAPGAAFRFNLMADDGKIAGRDIAENRRFGIAPSLALGMGTPTRFTLDYFHFNENDTPDYGIPWFYNRPAPVPHHNYYGFKGANFLRANVDIATAKVEHDFNDGLSFRTQLRFANYPRNAQISEPQINTTVNPIMTPTTPMSDLVVNRNQITVDSVEGMLWGQSDATVHFKTGFVDHTAVVGIEGGRETSDPTRTTFSNVPTASALHPDPDQPFTGTGALRSVVHTTAVSLGVYVLDTMKLGQKWEVTGGGRFDRFHTDYKQSVAPAVAFSRLDQQPTWRGALVYKPTQNGSVYFDYGTSFDPSAESLSLSAGNANLPPEKNKTYEVGSKWDVFQQKLSLAGSIFRTDKLNARETDPTNSALMVLAGNQRVDGLQVGATGHLPGRWEVVTGYAYLKSAVRSSKYYPGAIGYPLANVPRNTFNAWITHELPWWHIEAGLGTNSVSSRTASSTVPMVQVGSEQLLKAVPSYWVFNAMAKHKLAERVDLQANVYNLANRFYIDEPHPGHLVPGAGRSAVIGVDFKF